MMENENNFTAEPGNADKFFPLPIFVRIAVYDNLSSIPRIIDLKHNSVSEFIDTTTEKIYQISHTQGGKIPYTIIKEIVENLIHASFSEIIISIIDNGNKIMISDQGPGITDVEKAMLPGFTSATREMKKFIRGVGSGLPIVKETITFSGGSIDIKKNLKNGTVVILSINSTAPPIEKHKDAIKEPDSSDDEHENENDVIPGTLNIDPGPIAAAGTGFSVKSRDLKHEKNDDLLKRAGAEEQSLIKLSLRQIKILYLTLELEESGPSVISKELGLSLSTSFRELSYLEKEGLLKTFSSGKKRLSKKGFKYLEYYSNNF
jgi:hypothetical protein